MATVLLVPLLLLLILQLLYCCYYCSLLLLLVLLLLLKVFRKPSAHPVSREKAMQASGNDHNGTSFWQSCCELIHKSSQVKNSLKHDKRKNHAKAKSLGPLSSEHPSPGLRRAADQSHDRQPPTCMCWRPQPRAHAHDVAVVL